MFSVNLVLMPLLSYYKRAPSLFEATWKFRTFKMLLTAKPKRLSAFTPVSHDMWPSGKYHTVRPPYFSINTSMPYFSIPKHSPASPVFVIQLSRRSISVVFSFFVLIFIVCLINSALYFGDIIVCTVERKPKDPLAHQEAARKRGTSSIFSADALYIKEGV